MVRHTVGIAPVLHCEAEFPLRFLGVGLTVCSCQRISTTVDRFLTRKAQALLGLALDAAFLVVTTGLLGTACLLGTAGFGLFSISVVTEPEEPAEAVPIASISDLISAINSVGSIRS